ncbi:hypothetical protein F0562_030629 [Nyssa sinensis]|uniref:Uncharacterized protein n=1 Tax=Nyssa sinensis TaxID=561372 RepID=A0A5J5B0C4_9ASTE|nr:hypothetical protein F0562_030629 [Nyssa sinensis]
MNSPIIEGTDVARVSTPSSRRKRKNMVTAEQKGEASVRVLRENGPPTAFHQRCFEDGMESELGYDPRGVGSNEHFPSRPWYESHDLEAQLQLQLMSSVEVANKIEELKKKLEKIKMELGTS